MEQKEDWWTTSIWLQGLVLEGSSQLWSPPHLPKTPHGPLHCQGSHWLLHKQCCHHLPTNQVQISLWHLFFLYSEPVSYFIHHQQDLLMINGPSLSLALQLETWLYEIWAALHHVVICRGPCGQLWTTIASLLGPKYKPKGLEKLLHDNLGSDLLSNALPSVIIPSFDMKLQQPVFFSSWQVYKFLTCLTVLLMMMLHPCEPAPYKTKPLCQWWWWFPHALNLKICAHNCHEVYHVVTEASIDILVKCLLCGFFSPTGLLRSFGAVVGNRAASAWLLCKWCSTVEYSTMGAKTRVVIHPWLTLCLMQVQTWWTPTSPLCSRLRSRGNYLWIQVPPASNHPFRWKHNSRCHKVCGHC